MSRCGGGGGLPTNISFIYSIVQSLIYSFHSSKEGFWQTVPQCGGAGGFHAHTVERQRWRREEEGGVAVATEEIGSSGVDDGGGERRGLREF
jgi:hypothetical protein